MRPNATHVRLRPRVDLRPFFDFLNRDATTSGIVTKLAKMLTDQPRLPSLTDRSEAVAKFDVVALEAVARLSRRPVYGTRWVGSNIEKYFLGFTRRAGLSEARSFQAWRSVWRFLKTEHPDIGARIDRCEWCRAYWYRYHARSRRRRDRFCSPMCRLGQSMVKRLSETAKPFARDSLRAMINVFRETDAPSRPLDHRARRLVKLFLDPVQHRLPPVRSLRDATDPVACIVVWQFLFEAVPTMSGRLRRCDRCGDLFYAYRQSQRRCGERRCQQSRSTQK